MIYIKKETRNNQKELNKRMRQNEDSVNRNRTENPDTASDFETPRTKGEYKQQLQKIYEKTNDGHLKHDIAKELKHIKESGSNSGLK